MAGENGTEFSNDTFYSTQSPQSVTQTTLFVDTVDTITQDTTVLYSVTTEDFNTTQTTSFPVEYKQAFIQTPLAQGIAGSFVVISCVLTLYQVVLYLRCTALPVQRKCIMRILLMVPIYAINSWLSLLFFSNENCYIYFNTIRDCYEAVVIYSFMCLCYEYLGGEGTIMNEISGQPVRESLLLCTCCLTRKQYSLSFLRFCKRATLQFCFVKPVVAVITLVLQTYDKYKDGDFSVTKGYLYVTIVYNLSIGLAMYGLVLFYMATEDYLRPHKPLLKFFSVKAIIFVSFWQGVLLAILEKAGVISPIFVEDGDIGVGTVAGGYQNFIICIEMVLASLCLWFAFPHLAYKDDTNAELNHKTNSKGNSLRSISYGLSDAINPADIVADAIHNFHPHYQQYARHDTTDIEICAMGNDGISKPFQEGRNERSGVKGRNERGKGRRKDFYEEQQLEVPSVNTISARTSAPGVSGGEISGTSLAMNGLNGAEIVVRDEGPVLMPGLERRAKFSEKSNLLKSNEELA